MSYNGSGTFVINSSGQPVVTGTVISSTAFNALTADLGTGLSTAITKDGQTTTTAKIPFAAGLSAAVASNFAAGTVAAPAIYLSTDTGTGLYRIGANNDGFAISGTKLLDFGSALLGITGAATISTTLGVTGATTLSSTLAAGNTTITGSTVAAFKVNSSRADAVYCQDGDNNTAGQIDLKNTGAASGNFMVYRNSASTVAGTISHSGSTTVAYNTSSDYRLKENVKPMAGALEKVLLLKPVTYTWIEDKTPGEGFIAHELQEISPNCVTGEKDGLDKNGSPLYQGVDVSFLVATLTSAIQELAAKVAKLEAVQAAPQVEKKTE